jgi:hypothetical protein
VQQVTSAGWRGPLNPRLDMGIVGYCCKKESPGQVLHEHCWGNSRVIQRGIVQGVSALPNPLYPIQAGTAAASSSFSLPMAALSSGPIMGQSIDAGVLGAAVLLHHVLPHHRLADGAVCRAVGAPWRVLAVEVRAGTNLHLSSRL